MSRVQLALNVDDIDTAVAFYSQLLHAEPAKRRPGYANFALDDPALKLVLIENPGTGGSLNHLGIEVDSTEQVVDATRRFTAAGLPTDIEEGTTSETFPPRPPPPLSPAPKPAAPAEHRTVEGGHSSHPATVPHVAHRDDAGGSA